MFHEFPYEKPLVPQASNNDATDGLDVSPYVLRPIEADRAKPSPSWIRQHPVVFAWVVTTLLWSAALVIYQIVPALASVNPQATTDPATEALMQFFRPLTMLFHYLAATIYWTVIWTYGFALILTVTLIVLAWTR